MLSVHSDEHFMKQALLEARKAYEQGEVPVGAVVVCNKQIIARAHNQTELLN
ncbi:MAG: nucleoside deaminase, partial [Bacteroidetes bacterium]